jgi:CRP-like cAMP-binding protein
MENTPECQYNAIIEQSIEKFPELWIEKEYAQEKSLWSIGGIATNIYYIKSGLIRTFNEVSDSATLIDNTVGMYFSGDSVVPYKSFIDKVPSLFGGQTIDKKSVILSMSRQNWDVAVSQMPELVRALDKIVIEKFYKYIRYFSIMASFDARKRYKMLITDGDSRLSQVKEKYLASFVGVSYQTFCTISSEVSKKTSRNKKNISKKPQK